MDLLKKLDEAHDARIRDPQDGPQITWHKEPAPCKKGGCGKKRGFALRIKALAMAACGAAKSILFGPSIPDAVATERRNKCAKCPLFMQDGGVAYCGVPFGLKVHRDVKKEGCGCPVEHMILDAKKACPKDPPEWPEYT